MAVGRYGILREEVSVIDQLPWAMSSNTKTAPEAAATQVQTPIFLYLGGGNRVRCLPLVDGKMRGIGIHSSSSWSVLLRLLQRDECKKGVPSWSPLSYQRLFVIRLADFAKMAEVLSIQRPRIRSQVRADMSYRRTVQRYLPNAVTVNRSAPAQLARKVQNLNFRDKV